MATVQVFSARCRACGKEIRGTSRASADYNLLQHEEFVHPEEAKKKGEARGLHPARDEAHTPAKRSVR